MRLGSLYNLCSYCSPYPPVADKVVKRRLEQAEEASSRLAKAGIHPPPSFRHRPESTCLLQAGWLIQAIPA